MLFIVKTISRMSVCNSYDRRDVQDEKLGWGDSDRNEDHREGKADEMLLEFCRCGSLAQVESAFAYGASITTVDGRGETSLFRACGREDENALPIVQLLLEKGSVISQQDLSGQTALHQAAEFSSAAVMAALLTSKQNQNLVNCVSSALHLCCYRDDVEAANVARVLLDGGSNIEQKGPDFRRSPLLIACEWSRPEVVALLLERGADVNVLDDSDNTALHLACLNADFGEPIATVLVNAGVQVSKSIKNKFGRSAFEVALGTNGAIAKFLAKHVEISNVVSDPLCYLDLAVEGEESDFCSVLKENPDQSQKVWSILGNGRKLSLCG
jgi:ankyrin repeat protein